MSSETTLQVYHHHLKIPIETYFDTVKEFLNPWDERAYQYAVDRHLEKTDDHGIVGMVRQEKDENFVYLDAAVRYPVNTRNQIKQDSRSINYLSL